MLMSDFTFLFSRNEAAGLHLYEALCKYWCIVKLMLMKAGQPE